jgi:hypothetical protein
MHHGHGNGSGSAASVSGHIKHCARGQSSARGRGGAPTGDALPGSVQTLGPRKRTARMYDSLRLDHHLVKKRVRVWWAGDAKWYHGIVHEFDQVDDSHIVRYDDGDVQRHLLNSPAEMWEFEPHVEVEPVGNLEESKQIARGMELLLLAANATGLPLSLLQGWSCSKLKEKNNWEFVGPDGSSRFNSVRLAVCHLVAECEMMEGAMDAPGTPLVQEEDLYEEVIEPEPTERGGAAVAGKMAQAGGGGVAEASVSVSLSLNTRSADGRLVAVQLEVRRQPGSRRASEREPRRLRLNEPPPKRGRHAQGGGGAPSDEQLSEPLMGCGMQPLSAPTCQGPVPGRSSRRKKDASQHRCYACAGCLAFSRGKSAGCGECPSCLKPYSRRLCKMRCCQHPKFIVADEEKDDGDGTTWVACDRCLKWRR